jgi:hypothetical protein
LNDLKSQNQSEEDVNQQETLNQAIKTREIQLENDNRIIAHKHVNSAELSRKLVFILQIEYYKPITVSKNPMQC